MSSWGRNNTAQSANSSTTMETSNGAPIGVQSLVKGSGGGEVPISMSTNAAFGNTSPGSAASVDVGLFNNNTPGAFVPNLQTGIFGVSATEMANNVANRSQNRPAHAGWVYRKGGTGPIVQVGYTGTANGYNNTDVITVASLQAGGNATITLSTNSTGGALVLTIANPGAGFSVVNATPNVSIANSTGGASSGTGATFFAYAGGRAGRVMTETLVAMGSLGAQSAGYGTPALVAQSNTIAANTYYPGA